MRDPEVDDELFEERLRDRLQLLDSPSGADYLVADLPTIDIVIASATLFAVTAGLLWWAY